MTTGSANQLQQIHNSQVCTFSTEQKHIFKHQTEKTSTAVLNMKLLLYT